MGAMQVAADLTGVQRGGSSRVGMQDSGAANVMCRLLQVPVVSVPAKHPAPMHIAFRLESIQHLQGMPHCFRRQKGLDAETTIDMLGKCR